MPEFVVVLVEPKYPGNIGAVARCMKNFGVSRLVLVKPCEVDMTAYARAMHATEVLEQARTVQTFDEAIAGLDYLAATSSIEAHTDKHHLRTPFLLDAFATDISTIQGTVGLVFGREDYGLFNEEIARCDAMIKIPTTDVYPSLNLSHAVSVVLYELYNRKRQTRSRRRLAKVETDTLHGFFKELLDETNYPAHKKARTTIMFRRIIGRAMLSTWEYHTLMGVLSGALKKLRKDKD